MSVSVGARSYIEGVLAGLRSPARRPDNGSTCSRCRIQHTAYRIHHHTCRSFSCGIPWHPVFGCPARRASNSEPGNKAQLLIHPARIVSTYLSLVALVALVVFSRSRHTPGTLRSSWSTWPRDDAPSVVRADAFAARCAVRYLSLAALITIARSATCSRRIRSRWMDQPPARGNWV